VPLGWHGLPSRASTGRERTAKRAVCAAPLLPRDAPPSHAQEEPWARPGRSPAMGQRLRRPWHGRAREQSPGRTRPWARHPSPLNKASPPRRLPIGAGAQRRKPEQSTWNSTAPPRRATVPTPPGLAVASAVRGGVSGHCAARSWVEFPEGGRPRCQRASIRQSRPSSPPGGLEPQPPWQVAGDSGLAGCRVHDRWCGALVGPSGL
jgi:hypothetical protein